MDLSEVKLYRQEVEAAADLKMDWSKLENATAVVIGASSMIGRCLVDILLCRKAACLSTARMRVICIGRDKRKLEAMFASKGAECYSVDIRSTKSVEELFLSVGEADYIFNFSSPSKSDQCRDIPTEIFECNVLGTRNILEQCKKLNAVYVFASSFDIYGNNVNDVKQFTESLNGEIDTLSNRACYFESKRMCETLCKCYSSQYGVKFFVFRFPKVFGPTMNLHSSSLIVNKAICDCLHGRQFVMDSLGLQKYPFIYVFDAVHGVLKGVLDGEDCNAYNVSDECCETRVIDIVQYICSKFGMQVKTASSSSRKDFFEKPLDKTLDSSKLKAVGWKCMNTAEEGADKTILIMQALLCY